MTTIELVTPELTFDQAFEIWIGNRIIQPHLGEYTSARYISERTEWDYRQYARALSKFFGQMKMGEIHIGHLRQYHHGRLFADGPWEEKCGPNRIRKEVAMLHRMMSSAGCWTEEFINFFRPLQRHDSDVPRAMEPDDQRRFLAIAASRAEWSFVLWYTVAALQTCMATNEMRTLQLRDVSIEYRMVTVRGEGAKNKFRRRAIPLETDEAVWAFEQLIKRARELGAHSPYHYLFPIMASKGSYDPTRGMSDSGLKKRWDEVRIAADLKWLRPYDLRHTAITRYAEAGTPIAIIMSFAGHISPKMQQHYTTISMMAKRKAVASTWSVGVPKSEPARFERAHA